MAECVGQTRLLFLDSPYVSTATHVCAVLNQRTAAMVCNERMFIVLGAAVIGLRCDAVLESELVFVANMLIKLLSSTPFIDVLPEIN